MNRGSRDEIIGNIRQALHRREPLSVSVQRALVERIATHQAHVKPHLDGDIVSRFAEKVSAAAGDIERLMGLGNVSRAVSEYLDREGLPKAIVTSADERMSQVRWSNELTVESRPAAEHDRVSVTTAFAGIAETGTVVMLSAHTNPTTLNFLPEHHIVLLDRERVVAHLEDAWALVRKEQAHMPRTINLITGPSRTGDVELQMEFGAHGPRRVYVLLIGSEP